MRRQKKHSSTSSTTSANKQETRSPPRHKPWRTSLIFSCNRSHIQRKHSLHRLEILRLQEGLNPFQRPSCSGGHGRKFLSGFLQSENRFLLLLFNNSLTQIAHGVQLLSHFVCKFHIIFLFEQLPFLYTAQFLLKDQPKEIQQIVASTMGIVNSFV